MELSAISILLSSHNLPFGEVGKYFFSPPIGIEPNKWIVIKLKFENPSLLTLPAGKTEFFVSYDDEIVGIGNLESFTLYPLSTSSVEGTFTANTSSDESKSVKISGVIKYDLLVTSIDVPFDYYPNEEQTRKFIQ